MNWSAATRPGLFAGGRRGPGQHSRVRRHCRADPDCVIADGAVVWAEKRVLHYIAQSHVASPLTGSPVLFEKGIFQELLTLPQGMGGSVLLRKYPAHVHTVYIADRNELADADTPEALAQLEALARQKL